MSNVSPYTPTKAIDSRDRLIGRDSEFDALLSAVATGRNVIVSGERGVGKTSIATVLASALNASSDIPSADGRVIHHAFLGVFSCGPTTSLEDLTDGLLRSLSRSSGVDLTSGQRHSAGVKVNAGIFTADAKTDLDPRKATACATQIVDAIARLRSAGHFQRDATIALIVDETDQLSESAHIGTWVRTASEMLSAERMPSTSFILVGQKALVRRLRQEHPSVPRAFEILWLEPLTQDSCEQIVKQGESISGVEFDSEIRLAIAKASLGFPAVVQRLADACVAVDRDRYVDVLDFEDGLSAAIDRVRGEKTLDSITELTGQVGRRILTFLAEKEKSIPVEEIESTLPDTGERVSATVTALERLGVVERDFEGIRVVDRLLAAYVTLEETRARELREVRELARMLEGREWKVRAIGPTDHRGVDLVASKGRWVLRRRLGITYVGTAARLGTKGIERLRMHLEKAKEIHGLDEILLVGHGRIDGPLSKSLSASDWLRYIPWDLLERRAVV